MRSKALMAVVLGLVHLAAAHAERPASLAEIAPHCRSLVKARFEERSSGALIFRVEKIYVDEIPEAAPQCAL